MTNRISRFSIVGVDPTDQSLLYYLSTPPINGVNIVPVSYCSQVFMSMSEDAARLLSESGYVVVPVHNVKASLVTTPIDIIGVYESSPRDIYDLLGINRFKLSISPPLSGLGYCVAVIDTGIRSTHQLLGGKVIYSKNFTGDEDGDIFDHGTGVASVIHAVAPDTSILDMKVLGDDGEGTEEEAVLAINECIELLYTNIEVAPNVINMSIGSPDDGNPSNPLRVACKEAMAQGIVVVAAAGNGGPGASTVINPACEPYVVAVGSVAKPGLEVSEFSSRGPTTEGEVKPDTTFIGEDLIIASSDDDGEIVAKSGTSFSAPLVSGIVLLTMEGLVKTYSIPREMYVGKNVLTNTMIIDKMLPSVCIKPKGAPEEKDNSYGYGLPIGSAIQQTTTAAGIIDIGGTIALSMSMMLMIMMSRIVARE